MTHFSMSRGTIKRLHYISGITLSIFIAAHLLNHFFAYAGPEAHINVMQQLRLVYHHPVVETILLLAVVFQIATGLRLLYKRDANNMAERLQVYSGLYLSFFLLVHVGAVLAGRYVMQLDTNFYYAAAGLNYFPATLFFIPYYFLAVAAISVHVAAIHYLKTKSVIAANAIAIAGIVAATIIILAFTNNFQWRTMPPAYERFIQSFFG